MKTAKLFSLGLSVFNLAILLAHIGTAYGVFRLGAILTLLVLILLCTLPLGVQGLFIAVRSRGGYLNRGDASLAVMPAVGVLSGILLAIVFGVYTGS